MADFTAEQLNDIASRTVDFLNRLKDDDALQTRIKGLEKWDMDGLHGILEDEGISMTKDELGVAAGMIVKAVAPQAGAELSEDELEAVAGGKGDAGFGGVGESITSAPGNTAGFFTGLGNTVAHGVIGDGVVGAANSVANAFSGW
jgi:hypothetical protein